MLRVSFSLLAIALLPISSAQIIANVPACLRSCIRQYNSRCDDLDITCTSSLPSSLYQIHTGQASANSPPAVTSSPKWRTATNPPAMIFSTFLTSLPPSNPSANSMATLSLTARSQAPTRSQLVLAPAPLARSRIH